MAEKDKKKFDIKGLLLDIGLLAGTIVAGFVLFFIYGQYTAMVNEKIISANVHRIFVAVTISAAGFLYYIIVKKFVLSRKKISWIFWLTMFTAALFVILAALFIVFGVGSEIILAYTFLSLMLYPFFVCVIAFVYFFWGYVKKEFNRKPDRLG